MSETTSTRVKLSTLTMIAFKAAMNAARIAVYDYTKKDGTASSFFVAYNASDAEICRGNVKPDFASGGVPNISTFEGDTEGETFHVMHKSVVAKAEY